MAFTSDNYDSSFDGVGFLDEFQNSFSAAGPDKGVGYVARPVASGNGKTIVDTFGRIKKEFTVPIVCLKAQLDMLEAKIDTKKTLIYHEGTLNNVILLYVRNRRKATDKAGEDIYRAELLCIEG